MTEGAGKQHPQLVLSCDSCDHAEKTNSKTYPVKCKASKPIPMMVHEYCIAWFGYVGCASHSSAPQPAAAEPIFHLEDCEKCYKALEELKKDLKADAEQRDLAEDLEASQIAYEGMRRAELDKRESQLREIENIIVMNGTAGCGIYINRYISKELKAISLLRGDGKP